MDTVCGLPLCGAGFSLQRASARRISTRLTRRILPPIERAGLHRVWNDIIFDAAKTLASYAPGVPVRPSRWLACCEVETLQLRNVRMRDARRLQIHRTGAVVVEQSVNTDKRLPETHR